MAKERYGNMETPDLGPSTLEPSPTKSKPSKFAWLWPAITNEEEARKAARVGAYFSVFLAVCNCVLALIAIATKEPFLGIDRWGLIDAGLFAVVAWRVFRFSFPWAVFGLLLESAGIFWRWYQNGQIGNFVGPAIVVLALIAGVRGTGFLSKKGNLNGLLAAIVVGVFAVGFAVVVHRTVQPSESLESRNDTPDASKLQNDFLSLNEDYDADNWNDFRTELLSREHYLDDLKEQDRRVQLLLRKEPADSDKCGRLGEQALQGVITAEESLMSFAKMNTVLTDDSSTSAQSLIAQSHSASQKWNSSVENMKTCDDSK